MFSTFYAVSSPGQTKSSSATYTEHSRSSKLKSICWSLLPPPLPGNSMWHCAITLATLFSAYITSCHWQLITQSNRIQSIPSHWGARWELKLLWGDQFIISFLLDDISHRSVRPSVVVDVAQQINTNGTNYFYQLLMAHERQHQSSKRRLRDMWCVWIRVVLRSPRHDLFVADYTKQFYKLLAFVIEINKIHAIIIITSQLPTTKPQTRWVFCGGGKTAFPAQLYSSYPSTVG